MDTEIMVEALPLLGVCNLCLNEGAVISMLTSQNHNGNLELYAEMLLKCFSIDVSLLELGDTKRLICSPCAGRLRDCCDFRLQVEASLKMLETSVKAFKDDGAAVKQELDTECMDQSMDYVTCDADDDEDDMFLKDIAIKKEQKPAEQSPKKLKIKLRKVKKLKIESVELANNSENNTMITLSEVEAVLSRGLFPFKIKKGAYCYSCVICSENSSRLENIKSHISVHSTVNILVAFRKMLFSKSQRFYLADSNLRCKICTTDIRNYDELTHHIDNCKRISGGINYSKYSHLPFKLEKDQLDCPVCKKTFLNFVNLNTHMNLHYPNYICESCGKAFASKARLRGHMRTHEIGSFPCKYCDATFDRVTKRENHVSKEHKSGVRYACKRCKISLPSFYARQKHLAEVHNEELKRYKCKACPQSYITPGHLSSHVRRDHLNERNHKCEQCELAFYTRNALKMHMIKHDGERIHACHICNKSYQRKKTLREHMRIHDNDKRFVCPVCGRAFTQKCTLKGHLKVHERKIEIDDHVMQPLNSI